MSMKASGLHLEWLPGGLCRQAPRVHLIPEPPSLPNFQFQTSILPIRPDQVRLSFLFIIESVKLDSRYACFASCPFPFF